jgi:hypothetical protein
MSGGAPAIDSDNNIYVLTGNGAFDGNNESYANSFVKLTTPGLNVADYFTPSNQSDLDLNDQDVGSSGTSVLFDRTTGPHYMVGGSKSGTIYVVNRDSMGHFNSTDVVKQEWVADGRSFSTPAFWNNTLYYFGIQFKTDHPGESFPFNTTTGLFATTPSASTTSRFRFTGATPSISASSPTTNGIVWAIETGSHGTDHGPKLAGPAVLHAFEAMDISKELWNSAAVATDAAGNAVKFTVPTIANGRVYVPTRGNDDTIGGGTIFGQVDVYGLLP